MRSGLVPTGLRPRAPPPAFDAMRIPSSAAFALSLVLAQPTWLPAQESSSERPAFGFLRWSEDWSRFTGGDEALDPIKHVQLDDAGDIWASFGFRAEARLEAWDDFAFDPPVSNDDTFTVSRLLAHADVHFGDDVRVFVEGKTAQASDRDLPGGRRALDADYFDLQQLFVDARFPLGDDSSVTVRAGRQSVSFGAQRLVSPLPWGNTLRTWEGLSAIARCGPWTATALLLGYVPVDGSEFNHRDDDELLLGVYATRPLAAGGGLDIYALGNTRDDVSVNGTNGDAERLTLGVRTWGKFERGFDYEAEGAWQTGDVDSADVSAGFLTATLGWRPTNQTCKRRHWVGFDWASGDGSPGGRVGTFDQLYPLGHAFFGFMDFIGRQNILSIHTGVSAQPTDRLTLSATALEFWLEDQDDALYNAGGGVLRAPGSFDSSNVGAELDLMARWKHDAHLSFYGGYSHFFPGAALADSGPDEDVDFAYVGLQLTY